jgi:hypothetical protein
MARQQERRRFLPGARLSLDQGPRAGAATSHRLVSNIDVAITDSSMDSACRIDDDAALAANYWRRARMPFNVTGQPGLVIPAGLLGSLSRAGLRLDQVRTAALLRHRPHLRDHGIAGHGLIRCSWYRAFAVPDETGQLIATMSD